MKKLLYIIFFLLVCMPTFAATTYTTNYSLSKPGVGDTGWGAIVNTNFDTIDSQLKLNELNADDAASDSNWTLHGSYPSACSSGQFVSAIGDTLTCSTPTDTNTTYTASGTLLNLTGTTFSVNTGTLTDTKYCIYTTGTGIVCNSEGGSGTGDMTKAVYDTNSNNIVDTATALAADPSDCAAGTVATAIAASGALTCSITPLVSGGTLTSGYHCRYDGTGIDCDRVEDASGTCGANSVCMGGHTHPTTEVSGVNAGTDLTADLEEEVTEGSLADSTIVSADVKDNTLTASDLADSLDLGGDTSFEIPNGASPTVDAAGEIAIDTTDNQIKYYGGAERVVTYKQQRCFGLETPAAADDNVPIFFPTDAITVTNFYCMTQGGTSVGITISDGTNTFEEVVCDADGQADDGSITNATFSANERVEFDVGTVTGSVTWVTGCLTYTTTAE